MARPAAIRATPPSRPPSPLLPWLFWPPPRLLRMPLIDCILTLPRLN